MKVGQKIINTQRINMLKIILLMLVMSTGQAEAGIAGDIASSIMSALWAGIKWFFSWIFNAIWNAIKDMFISIGNYILEGVKAMANDIFAAITVAEELVKKNANQTLQSFLGPDSFNTSKILIDMMYTGKLPIQWYLNSVDLDDEMKFLDKVLDNFQIIAILTFSVTMAFNLLCGIILCWYCKSRSFLLKVNGIEERENRRMIANYEKNKSKVRHRLREENKAKNRLMKIQALRQN